jgi:hypothetical protein
MEFDFLKISLLRKIKYLPDFLSKMTFVKHQLNKLNSENFGN